MCDASLIIQSTRPQSKFRHSQEAELRAQAKAKVARTHRPSFPGCLCPSLLLNSQELFVFPQRNTRHVYISVISPHIPKHRLGPFHRSAARLFGIGQQKPDDTMGPAPSGCLHSSFILIIQDTETFWVVFILVNEPTY